MWASLLGYLAHLCKDLWWHNLQAPHTHTSVHSCMYVRTYVYTYMCVYVYCITCRFHHLGLFYAPRPNPKPWFTTLHRWTCLRTWFSMYLGPKNDNLPLPYLLHKQNIELRALLLVRLCSCVNYLTSLVSNDEILLYQCNNQICNYAQTKWCMKQLKDYL